MNMRWMMALVALLAGAAGCRGAASTADIPAVTGFEAERYMGRWYEIARLPHRFERGMDQVTADYSLAGDGRITVVNSGVKAGEPRRIQGVARFTGAPGCGELEVSFFRPFWGDYRIIRLEPDYSAAVVTSGTRDYLWILSRTPELEPEQLRSYINDAKALGFAVDRLEFPAPVKVTPR